jgi:hypothetical protein
MDPMEAATSLSRSTFKTQQFVLKQSLLIPYLS